MAYEQPALVYLRRVEYVSNKLRQETTSSGTVEQFLDWGGRMQSFLGGRELAGTTTIGINKFNVAVKRFSQIGTRQKNSTSIAL